ncbi:hypothetical protein [Salinibacterium sp. ZJ450]|uniref:hypothetical protein n=1 Tax=Salinibacterium sp. ZJ450 TaxID=2708338 RepID=UPI001421A5F5|nr:hypothetical protein [Salinibacterium sp. ZJ450]
MLTVSAALCRVGHVASFGQLSAAGLTGRQLRAAVQTGGINRLRRGTYACAHLHPVLADAARLGAAVTCVSALRAAGVWAGNDRRLHVQVRPNASHLASPHELGSTVRYHWERPRFPAVTPWWTGPLQSLWQAMHCLDEENAIAAMESAVHEGFLTAAEVTRLAGLAPRRLIDGIRRLDFASGSGNETIVRLRLQHAGYRVESQAFVPGMGHEDLVIEGCVGLDVDGRQWHGEDRFAIDRDRDIHVEGLGRRALRIRTAHIEDTWPHTLAAIDRVVADALREQNRRVGRVVLTVDDPLDALPQRYRRQ